MILRESTKIERIATLTRRLVINREISTADLAQEIGVSQRTIQRDLAEMSRVLPIYPDNGLWLYLDEPDQISPY